MFIILFLLPNISKENIDFEHICFNGSAKTHDYCLLLVEMIGKEEGGQRYGVFGHLIRGVCPGWNTLK
jgi:hypothetical protein